MLNKKNVVIVGGGFCGMMTAVYLIRFRQPLNIIIINKGYAFGKGVAYSAYTDKYLLNVRAINMSAFEDDRYHFVEWLRHQLSHNHIPENILANVYAPRKMYGEYLNHVWKQTLKNKQQDTQVSIIEERAVNIIENDKGLTIFLSNGEFIAADATILATGNTVPRNIPLKNKTFLHSHKYFANPWTKDCVSNVHQLKNILIVGNGLTMVDTLQGLIDNGFKGTVYTLSPNGFKLIPHRYNLLVYDKIIKELPEKYTLYSLFNLIRRHIKSLTDVGIGAHLVIDALRPFTQEIWQSLTLEEKRFFLKKLCHAWTILRHRLPMHIFEMVQNMRMQKSMITITGKVQDITEGTTAAVTYFDYNLKKEETVFVDRVINCTGPESDIRRSANELLKNLASGGLIMPDVFNLGIEADAITGAVINSKGEKSDRVFTTGGSLKGMLWENTAVPDIRIQVKLLAMHLEKKLKEESLKYEI